MNNLPNNTGTITYNTNDAGFSVVSPNATPVTQDPTVKFQTSTGNTTQLSSGQVYVQHPAVTPRVFPSQPPPAPPDTSNLTAIQEQVRRKTAIAQAMKDYDALSASTQAAGFQSANNAGNVYANRLMQSGVNPLASGVVAAQAKLPIYKQIADINAQKDQTRLDATNKADSLAASIASNIANIQMGYANMLADYNTKQTGYNLDLTKFQSGLNEQQYQYNQDYRLKAAQLAAQYGATTGVPGSRTGTNVRHLVPGVDGSPGYIPNDGPIIPGTGAFAGNGRSAALGW